MKIPASRILCRMVAFLLPSVCVHAADIIDFEDYETGSVKGQPTGGAARWDSNLNQTQSPVWIVVDGESPDGSKCLATTDTPSGADQWVRADYFWDEMAVSENGFDAEGTYLLSMDICMPQSALTNGNFDVYVNYMQGANPLGNKGTRVSYFVIGSNGNLTLQDAGWKRLNGFLYSAAGGSTGWHTIQFRIDYADGVYDILADGEEVISDYAFTSAPETMASFQGIRIRNCLNTLEGTRLLVDNISLTRLDRP
ncbi:MAG: hypothetical protein ACI4QT_01900, partial [Kiritimatiellia bacterium]